MASSSEEQQIIKGKEKSSKEPKRKWTRKEDKALLAALFNLCKVGWKRENGKFKNGYTSVLEKELKMKLPGSNLKASPHIESRLKLLKRQYDEITAMQGAKGIQWNTKAQKLICEDDAVWNRWLKSHPLAKGLRNRQFPYYDDLHLIFGNRILKRFRKASDDGKTLDDEEEILERNSENNQLATLMAADSSNENEKSEGNRNISEDALHERANGHAEDSVGGDRSNDLDLLADATREAEIPTQEGSTSSGRANRNRRSGESSDSGSSGQEELLKFSGNYLKKCERHLSLLLGMLGREAAADKAAAKKRAGLNGELRKLSNLNLHARLRAATLIVGDPAKLDLFYSLPKGERIEWVSMLLSGLL